MANRPNQRPKSTITPGTIIAILLIVFIPILLWMFMTPGGAGEYQFYAGPILPLTSLSGAENVTVERTVTLDFSDFAEPGISVLDENTVIVTDSYELTNTSDQDVTLELVWGFEGQLTDDPALIPTVTVDGAPADAVLYPSTDNDGAVRSASNFEKYKEVLTETDYLSIAMAETPEWNVPVKVYHFFNMSYEGAADQAQYLDVGYNYGDETNLWTPIYRMASYDQENKCYHLLFDLDGDAWIYIIGDDLVDMQVGSSSFYTVGDDTAAEQAGFHYEMETYESTFMECLWKHAQEYRYEPGPGGNPALDLTTPEMLFDGAMKIIAETSYQNASDNVRLMDTVFGKVYSIKRMLYWVFPVEIPAGATVTVSGVYEQETSSNFDSTTSSRNGFDMATTLCSNLNFSGQTVTLANTRHITIADGGEGQNFGFDPENGITTVPLDLSTERYFLDILANQ